VRPAITTLRSSGRSARTTSVTLAPAKPSSHSEQSPGRNRREELRGGRGRCLMSALTHDLHTCRSKDVVDGDWIDMIRDHGVPRDAALARPTRPSGSRDAARRLAELQDVSRPPHPSSRNHERPRNPNRRSITSGPSNAIRTRGHPIPGKRCISCEILSIHQGNILVSGCRGGSTARRPRARPRSTDRCLEPVSSPRSKRCRPWGIGGSGLGSQGACSRRATSSHARPGGRSVRPPT
jgi:hypothetical protein